MIPEDKLYICPCCNGDGQETCTNPDHGFISAMGFHEIGRLGCPLCGHDPKHKVKNGGSCITCDGAGKVTLDQYNEFCEQTGYDYEPIKTSNNSNSQMSKVQEDKEVY